MLAASQRQKLDESNDTLFYEHPRFVTHVDERFIEQLTELYQQRLTPNSCVLDLMSSWISHLTVLQNAPHHPNLQTKMSLIYYAAAIYIVSSACFFGCGRGREPVPSYLAVAILEKITTPKLGSTYQNRIRH